MKDYLTRRLLTIAALASPFVLALFVGAATAEAAVIRGRSAHRVGAASSGLHGAALGITVAAVVLVVLAASYLAVRSSLQAPTASQPVQLAADRDTELDGTRKAA
jgi:hypothetical protein